MGKIEEGSKHAELVACLRFLEEDRLLANMLEQAKTKGQSRSHGGGRGGGQVTTTNTGSRKQNRAHRQLYTRLLSLYPGILDDMCPDLALNILNKVDQWQFNAFLLDRLTAGHCLPSICLHILYKTGLMNHFQMDPTDVLSFFRLLERGYHSGNPYHNALHASDVTQAMYVYCQQNCILPYLSPVELLAALVSAVSHDLDHPGVNEKFLVSTGSHLALLYDNVSVLENHHWRSAISCFVDSGMTKYLTDIQFLEFTELVRSLVLATDISRQQEFLTQLRFFLDNQQLNLSLSHHRHFILQIAIKCADISNPCRDWAVSKLWSLRACEEFFRQGDVERQLGIDLTPICDRFNVTVAKVQVGFYSFVVEPLFIEWHRFLSNDLSEEMLRCFRQNQTKWEEEVLQEEIPGERIGHDIVEHTDNTADLPVCNPAPSCLAFPQKLGRRMSLPCNDPLLRVFDQMTQPDSDVTRAVNLKRNFSLTDRRRSSLLRGLFNRSSLKPGRGKLVRPTTVGIDCDVGKRGRTLQSRDTRFKSPVSVQFNEDVLSENTAYPPTLEGEECREKENSGYQPMTLEMDERLTRRRGSAPCNLILAETKMSTLLREHNNMNSNMRRGSLPSELLKEGLPKQLRTRVLNQNVATCSNKSKNLLRRRSMGPELLNMQPTGARDRQKYKNRPI